jgi:hypothetical protein
LCKSIADIAPHMLKMVKLRVLTNYLQSVRGLEDDDLIRVLRDDAPKLSDHTRVLAAVTAPDPDFNRGQLKAMILAVLLQEETYSLPENRLDEKVIEFEAAVVEASKALDLTELRRDDPDRWHHFDTYRIVLEAAWSNDGQISPDEARLLGVLRIHLSISQAEHWRISALLKRFPKDGCALHTADEVNDARKDLQRQGVLWQFRDEDNRNVDVIPAEVAEVVRREHAGHELQSVNFPPVTLARRDPDGRPAGRAGPARAGPIGAEVGTGRAGGGGRGAADGATRRPGQGQVIRGVRLVRAEVVGSEGRTGGPVGRVL